MYNAQIYQLHYKWPYSYNQQNLHNNQEIRKDRANKIKRIAMVPMEDLVDHSSLGQLSPQWPNNLYCPLFFSSVAHQYLPVDACLTHLLRSLPFHTKGNMHGLCLSLEIVTQSTLPTTKKMGSFEVHICKYIYP